MLARPKQGPQP